MLCVNVDVLTDGQVTGIEIEAPILDNVLRKEIAKVDLEKEVAVVQYTYQ